MNTYQQIRAWVLHPRQVVLRYEFQWFATWCRGAQGMLSIGLFIGLIVANAFLAPKVIAAAQSQTFSFSSSGVNAASTTINIASVFLAFALWVSMVLRRTLGPLRKERFRDLYMTGINIRELFPGLLAAPLAIDALLSLITCMSSYLMVALGGREVLLGGVSQFATSAWDQAFLDLYDRLWFLVPILLWFYAEVTSLALTSFVVLNVIPKGGIFGIVMCAILGVVILYGPSVVLIIISTIILVMQMMSGINASPSGVSVTGNTVNFSMSNFSLPVTIYVFVPLLTMLMSILMITICLRRLRSEKVWNKLRALAEAS